MSIDFKIRKIPNFIFDNRLWSLHRLGMTLSSKQYKPEESTLSTVKQKKILFSKCIKQINKLIPQFNIQHKRLQQLHFVGFHKMWCELPLLHIKQQINSKCFFRLSIPLMSPAKKYCLATGSWWILMVQSMAIIDSFSRWHGNTASVFS